MNINWENYGERLNELHEAADAAGASYSIGVKPKAGMCIVTIVTPVLGQVMFEREEAFDAIHTAINFLRQS